MTERKRSFWSWGLQDEPVDHKTLEKKIGLLCNALNVSPSDLTRTPPPSVDRIKLRAPRFQLPSSLRPFCSDDKRERLMRSFGKSFDDSCRALAMEYSNPPDYVATPSTEEQIHALLAFCQKESISVVPYGGGSSVVGGIEPSADARYKGCMSLDMQKFDKVLEVNRANRTIRVQAGIFGPKLERDLREHGLTMRHYPQSFEFSSVGGWIATRSGGHFATTHTHIDDFVSSVRMVTPAGVLQTRELPASGAGPDPNRLVIGSEGILGVITEAVMRVQERPKYRASVTVFFDDFMTAAESVRLIAQTNIHLANCRLIDGLEAMSNGLSSGQTALLLGWESSIVPNFDVQLKVCLDICERLGGQWNKDAAKSREGDQGERDSEAGNWRNSFIRAPYFRDQLIMHGFITETFETATTWSKFPAFHQGIISAVRQALDKVCGGKGVITCRFTHVYPDGPAPYYTVLAAGAPSMKARREQWAYIKRVASDTLIRLGGTITHHHAVGKMHQEHYMQESDDLFLRSLVAAKRELDPRMIMNPGVLISERFLADFERNRPMAPAFKLPAPLLRAKL